MPCFKGIAVSVHAEGAPLPEYSIQKHSKTGRITSYIPVPQPKVSSKTLGKPEKSKFAISVTLLTPGLAVPYSKPQATPHNPEPQPLYVAEDAATLLREGGIGAYTNVSDSPNETIAAYIYFDGRVKEEVATLLRPGEETWVNSRWVQDSTGGLAEREFLFREVGLERWLNGLDLDKQEGQAAKLERRREKLRKRRERQQIKLEQGIEDGAVAKQWSKAGNGLLVYGADATSPVVEDFSEEEDSDDDEPPESTGQIKVAMFRVLASGEIKKGEYSPQFEADDDGDAMDAGDDEADHTTSFAKPKALDPNSISTQTVTGLDGPDSPYAVFTFLYRGERQLRKMGILPIGKGKEPVSGGGKSSSRAIDFSNLAPLQSGGTVGFTNFRDNSEASGPKSRKKSNGSMKVDGDDSDVDDDEDIKTKDEPDDKEESFKTLLSPEEGQQLSEGLNRIKLKRQRSNDADLNNRQSPSLSAVASPTGDDSSPSPPAHLNLSSAVPPSLLNSAIFGNPNSNIGSPMKKHRSSILGSGSGSDGSGNGVSSLMGLPAIDILGQAERNAASSSSALGSGMSGYGGNAPSHTGDAMDDEEEL